MQLLIPFKSSQTCRYLYLFLSVIFAGIILKRWHHCCLKSVTDYNQEPKRYMKLSKIYDPREMNSYQFVAATGLVMTIVANLILLFIGKTVENFSALYLCWFVFFGAGTVVNLNSKPGDHDHHHHH